jgi:sugar O-acyltransferase (sialic acid O-acetyltransferase NeuD family)
VPHKRIVIAGAGGFGREVLAWLQSSPQYLETASVADVVFIADYESDVAVSRPIVSSIATYEPAEDDLVLCAIGDPVGKRAVAETLAGRGALFATFVHDRAVIGARVTFGEGAIICPGAILTTDIVIGRHVHININCSLGHDVTVGDYATISPASNLMGDAQVGPHAFLGTAATLVPHVKVGEGTRIGAGSVVLKDIDAHVTAFGNPCRVFSRPSK